jgi:hypothetical protein
MQVHAVPDSDKAYDASGRKLPWAYDLDASRNAENREPIEKGPFGRSQRRSRSGLSRSRSKTAEPRREEDRIRAEQVAAEDAVFGSLRRKGDGQARDALGEVDTNVVAAGTVGGAQAVAGASRGDSEATEVVLYGFGEELQWAALDFYERVSGGTVLEDYDRQPPGQRYDMGRSFGRAAGQRSLSKAALKKKNTFAGGDHWIKVTFDSRAAADLACARSPHIVKGYLVYAEPYLGRGPGKDEAIAATQAGAQITDDAVPMTFSTTAQNPVVEGSPNGSSTTATSATATTNQPTSQPAAQPALQRAPSDPFNTPATSSALQSQSQSQGQLTVRRQGRGIIPGTTQVELLPASAALLPKPAAKSWLRFLWPGEVIGSSVPKREDGGFDYDKAGLYWRLFWTIDSWLGTDFCGLRAE